MSIQPSATEANPPSDRGVPLASVFGEYGVFILDCDGLIFDPNELKTATFENVLDAHGYSSKTVEACRTFQRANFGNSRYRMLQMLVDGCFGERRAADFDALIADFRQRCRNGYCQQPEAVGMRNALARTSRFGCSLYIASGSYENELKDVFVRRVLATTCAKIYGSPAIKVQNIRHIREHRRQLVVELASACYSSEAQRLTWRRRKRAAPILYPRAIQLCAISC